MKKIAIFALTGFGIAMFAGAVAAALAKLLLISIGLTLGAIVMIVNAMILNDDDEFPPRWSGPSEDQTRSRFEVR